MKLGNYEFEIEDMIEQESENAKHFTLEVDGKTVVEIYDGVDADEDGLCSDIWVRVDGERYNWSWQFIIDFRKEVEYLYY